jgi:hypothetical protein
MQGPKFQKKKNPAELFLNHLNFIKLVGLLF